MEKLYKFIFLFLLITISIIIVIYPFTFEENFFKNEPLEDKDIILHRTKNKYNIGDQLSLNRIYGTTYNTQYYKHPWYDEAISQYPDSILAIYETLRESPEEYIPNFDKIRKSVDIFIEKNQSNNEMMEKINFINNPRVLCVHLRSGDMGNITQNFKNIIYSLRKEYDHIVVCCGIHNGDMDVEVSKTIIKNSVNTLFDDVDSNNIIISIEDPDVHLAMFRSCKNLLLCFGGFTILAGFLFQADKLYINEETFNIKKDIIGSPVWQDYLKPENHAFKELVYV